MPERGDTEVFSNPLPPTSHHHEDDDDYDSHHLTNDDFRKMLMTPKASSSSSLQSKSAFKKPSVKAEEEDDPAERRRKKKIYYAKLKRLEDERQQELASKYRDRATERRDGMNKDYEETEIISTTADYRAVAPDAKSGENYAERRKQVIQESKYLGGDMEHTHLVKGLDYALLEKVRAEISNKEREDEAEMEKVVTQKKEKKEEEVVPQEEKIPFKTKLGRNVYRILFKNRLPERNELFLPRRMAYVVDLEDEYADSDVPTTTIRSKADCPSVEASATLTTNDIVINKLTQILSYLRQGRRESKKLKKKEKGKLRDEEKPRDQMAGADDSIYADNELHDYPLAMPKTKEKRDRRERTERDDDRGRDRVERGEREYRDYYDRGDRGGDRADRRDRGERERDRGERGGRDRWDRDRGDRERGDRERGERDRDRRERKPYFEKPSEEDEDKDRMPSSAKDLVKNITERFKGFAELEEEKEVAAAKREEERIKKLKAKTEIDSYAECYPGMDEAADAIDDSDDEVDYTKMDHGNKKGPIGRWDFDTQEEYSDYMSNKEAMPKAAFQYGVKMADGRKTRRAGPKDEKAELDRQWQKIQNIIHKRKVPSDADLGNYKKMKY